MALIYSGVRIGDRVSIGERVIIQFNAVIGSRRLQLPAGCGGGDTSMPVRVHSLGDVIIGNDVEIGASTTIDRATLTTTRIGDGTKIDNQVQIAHNVTIGNGLSDLRRWPAFRAAWKSATGSFWAVVSGLPITSRSGRTPWWRPGLGSPPTWTAGAKMSGYPAMPHERTAGVFAFLMRHKRFLRRPRRRQVPRRGDGKTRPRKIIGGE